jgi:hypothetical protein
VRSDSRRAAIAALEAAGGVHGFRPRPATGGRGGEAAATIGGTPRRRHADQAAGSLFGLAGGARHEIGDDVRRGDEPGARDRFVERRLRVDRRGERPAETEGARQPADERRVQRLRAAVGADLLGAVQQRRERRRILAIVNRAAAHQRQAEIAELIDVRGLRERLAAVRRQRQAIVLPRLLRRQAERREPGAGDAFREDDAAGRRHDDALRVQPTMTEIAADRVELRDRRDHLLQQAHPDDQLDRDGAALGRAQQLREALSVGVVGDDGQRGVLAGRTIDLAHARIGDVAEVCQAALALPYRRFECRRRRELRSQPEHLEAVTRLLVEAEHPVAKRVRERRDRRGRLWGAHSWQQDIGTVPLLAHRLRPLSDLANRALNCRIAQMCRGRSRQCKAHATPAGTAGVRKPRVSVSF